MKTVKDLMHAGLWYLCDETCSRVWSIERSVGRTVAEVREVQEPEVVDGSVVWIEHAETVYADAEFLAKHFALPGPTVAMIDAMIANLDRDRFSFRVTIGGRRIASRGFFGDHPSEATIDGRIHRARMAIVRAAAAAYLLDDADCDRAAAFIAGCELATDGWIEVDAILQAKPNSAIQLG